MIGMAPAERAYGVASNDWCPIGITNDTADSLAALIDQHAVRDIRGDHGGPSDQTVKELLWIAKNIREMAAKSRARQAAFWGNTKPAPVVDNSDLLGDLA